MLAGFKSECWPVFDRNGGRLHVGIRRISFEVIFVPGLPKLVRGRRLVLELVGRLDDNEGWAGDQIMGLEQPVDRSL